MPFGLQAIVRSGSPPPLYCSPLPYDSIASRPLTPSCSRRRTTSIPWRTRHQRNSLWQRTTVRSWRSGATIRSALTTLFWYVCARGGELSHRGSGCSLRDLNGYRAVKKKQRRTDAVQWCDIARAWEYGIMVIVVSFVFSECLCNPIDVRRLYHYR